MTRDEPAPSRVRVVLCWIMGAAYLAAGINHFIDPEFYLRIMPPYLPWHRELVWLSGVAEIGLGLAVLAPRSRRAAGVGLVALLVAVFPANLHMALHAEDFPDAPPAALYARLPLQVVLIVWALYATGHLRRRQRGAGRGAPREAGREDVENPT